MVGGEGMMIFDQLLWTCECCGKSVPYPYYFCSECTEKLLGEPPKPIDPPEREENDERYHKM
jgi:predicted amidophosphoribosyltransferase